MLNNKRMPNTCEVGTRALLPPGRLQHALRHFNRPTINVNGFRPGPSRGSFIPQLWCRFESVHQFLFVYDFALKGNGNVNILIPSGYSDIMNKTEFLPKTNR